MDSGRAARVVQQMFDALSSHDPDAVRATLSEHFVCGDWNRDDFVELEFAYLAAFPDLSYKVDELFVCGDKVTSRWRFLGTHTGDDGPGLLTGYPATGTAVDIEGIAVARIEHDLVAEWWGQWNSLGLHQALGIVPEQRRLRPE